MQMARSAVDDSSPDPDLAPGSRVAVRTRFDGTPADGYEIVGLPTREGYRVRRRLDGVVLPAMFGKGDLVPERWRQSERW